MKLETKLKKFTKAKEIVDKFYAELIKIIARIYDNYIENITDAKIDGDWIHVNYESYCHGEWDSDYVNIPTKWIEDGFDYVADKKRMEDEEKERKREQNRLAAEKRKANKEKRELSEYKRLKKKFEGN